MADDALFIKSEPRLLVPLCLQLDSGPARILDIARQMTRFYAQEGIAIVLDTERVMRMLQEGAIILHEHDEETGRLIGTAALVVTQTFASRIGHVHHLLIAQCDPPDEQRRRAHAKNLLQELLRRARENHVDQIELRDPRVRAAALELGFRDEDHRDLILSL
jgi:N-acetylglutamate synthase-like GNAT family acetyltransferase